MVQFYLNHKDRPLSKKVLITGIGGQDGYFLTKLLLKRGYGIHGLIRRDSPKGLGAIGFLSSQDQARLIIHEGNIVSKDFIDELIRFSQFDQVYHLAAQSSVAQSIQHPRETIETNVLGLTNISTAIRDKSPGTRLIFAGSSEMFGNLTEGSQSELTPPHPQSPYGLTKELGFHLISTYRKHYGLWAASAVLFNHESEFRGHQFVTTKIIQAVARIGSGSEEILSLGNIHVQRDWGYAGDYMKGVVLMIDQESPEDYVLATGKLHSVKEFVNAAFNQVGINLTWSGAGLEEKAINEKNGRTIVQISEKFYRPGDVTGTCGDATKARNQLGWLPETSLEEIISKMLEHQKVPLVTS